MKISDEQICKIADKYSSNGCKSGVEITYDDFAKAARELIALAQEVEPLVFEKDEEGDLTAVTTQGTYEIRQPFRDYDRWTLVTLCGTEIEFSSKEYAIEIANDLNKAIVTKQLKYGGDE